LVSEKLARHECEPREPGNDAGLGHYDLREERGRWLLELAGALHAQLAATEKAAKGG
jgi:hypothetical protein